MRSIQALRALGPIDVKSIGRDPLLRWLILYPLVVAFLVRWGVPVLTAKLLVMYEFDLTPYYVLLMSFVVITTPMLTGMVIGFLLLDEKDARTLSALQVTPLTLQGYLVYRIAVPIVLSFIVSMVMVLIANLVPVQSLALVLSSATAACLTPFYALCLGAFASNKVQGFAISKGLGVLIVPPVAAYFIAEPLQWMVGVVPLYWPVKQFWMQNAPVAQQMIFFLLGLCYHAALLSLLIRRFQTSMER